MREACGDTEGSSGGRSGCQAVPGPVRRLMSLRLQLSGPGSGERGADRDPEESGDLVKVPSEVGL